MTLEFLQDERARLVRLGLWRTLRPLESPTGPVVTVAGCELLQLSSNDYLGLSADGRLRAAAAAASEVWGTGTGASRLITGTNLLHTEVEARLAALKGAADAVLFSSGYLANLGTIQALVGPKDAVVSDTLNHASIIDGCRLSGARILVYPHADPTAAAQLLEKARREGARRLLLITDSVFSMDGDLAPLVALSQVARRHQAIFMVDEAHATLLLGEGRGAVSGLGLRAELEVDVIVGTCSKAVGALGGFVAGSRELCDFLRNRARSFVFDTAPPAGVLGAIRRALELSEAEPERRQRVLAHARRLADALRALDYAVPEPAAAIVPVMIGEAERALRLAERLRELGILAVAIRPPTVPPGTARLRLCPIATHSDEQIDEVIAAFARLREVVLRG